MRASTRRLLLLALIVLLLNAGLSPAAHAQGGPPSGAAPYNRSRYFMPVITRDYRPLWSWSEMGTPAIAPAPHHIAMTIDSQGRPHIFWDTVSYGAPKFIYHAYRSTGGWTTPVPVASSLGESTLTEAPIVDSSGAVHLLWRNQLTPGENPRILYAAFQAGTWMVAEEVYRSSDGYSGLSGIPRTDGAGQLHATLVDASLFSERIYQMVRGLSGWQPAVSIFTGGYHPFATEADWSGGVHIYEDQGSTPPTLLYSYWRSGAFSVEDRLVSGKVFGRSTLLDGLNNLHMFWQDYIPIPGGSTWGFYHQCLEDNQNLLLPETPQGQQAISANLTAADERSRVVAVWQESDTVQVKLAVWAGCSLTDSQVVPTPADTGWEPIALTASAASSQVCILFSRSSYQVRYEVLCGRIP